MNLTVALAQTMQHGRPPACTICRAVREHFSSFQWFYLKTGPANLKRSTFPPRARTGIVRRSPRQPGTGTAYHPTALPTVGPYALPVPGFVPGRGHTGTVRWSPRQPGTGTAYHPTALPTVGPYALLVPGFVPGLLALAFGSSGCTCWPWHSGQVGVPSLPLSLSLSLPLTHDHSGGAYRYCPTDPTPDTWLAFCNAWPAAAA